MSTMNLFHYLTGSFELIFVSATFVQMDNMDMD